MQEVAVLASQLDKEPVDRLIPAARVRQLQYRHVILFNGLPAVGFLAALISLIWLPLGWLQAGLLVGMLYLTLCVGISVGYHRHFTHRSFMAPRVIRYLLALLGSMAAQGPLVAWVATHRRHHQNSDAPGDPHSPYYPSDRLVGRLRGLWHAHAGWLISHDMPNPLFYAKDLVQDPGLLRVSNLYPYWVILGLLIPTVVAGLITQSWIGAFSAFLWGGLARLFICGQLVWSINSICHTFGTASHMTKDRSTNNLVLAIPTFGEAWHNNHHAFPSSARFGLQWWELDLGWFTIRMMQGLRWASAVRTPSAQTENDCEDSSEG